MRLLLVLFTTLKFGKVLLTVGTMLLSLAVYASLFGWRFAAGFLFLLLMHELGHVAAARQRGIAMGAPAFVPFLGAFLMMRQPLPDAETEAHIAFGGPFIGALAAFAVYFWARAEHTMLGLAVAYSGFILNLFNLLPVSPLDGGRITAVLGPRIWLFGAPVLLALLLYQPNPVLVIVLLLAIPQLQVAWRYDPNHPANARYYGVGRRVKIEYTALYLGLVVLLGLITYSVHATLLAWSYG